MQKFDYSYSKDLYDHSQWTLARTVRSVSDDQEYQIAGYDAIVNGELYRVTPEVPPLGKYLIGLSIILFKNAQIMSLIFYIFSIFIFYYLAYLVLKNDQLTKIATVIFMTEPLLFSQATISMMDLPLLITLMIHCIFLLKLLKNAETKNSFTKDLPLLVGAGFSLGAFLSVKIGFFALVIIAADIFILLKNRKISYFVHILLGSFLFYFASYLPFFMRGHSFLELLKAQKWMIIWYLSSEVKPLLGMPLISLSLGLYKNWSKGSQFNRISEWTILWPFYLGTIFALVKHFVKNRARFSNDYLYTFLICFGFFGLFIIIPFWVRYLVMILPFLIIFFITFASRLNKKILLILLVIYCFQIAVYLYQPLRQDYLNGLAQAWEKGAYQDLYNSVDIATKKSESRQQFWRANQQFDRDLGTLKKIVTIKKEGNFWQYPQTVDIKINYQTPITTYVDKYKTQFIKENGQWKIKWNYNPGYAQSKYINGTYGLLTTEDGEITSEGGKRPFYSVTLSKIKDEGQLQQQLLYLTGLKKYDVELKYKANNQIDWPTEIGFLKDKLTIASSEALVLDPGINIDMKETRVYSSAVYADPKLFQIIENRQFPLLPILNPKLGGEIKIIIDNRIKYQVVKKSEDGHDVVLRGFVYRKIGLP